MPEYNIATSSGRKTYRIYRQQRNDSCGPACLRTAIYQLKRRELTEEQLRDVSGGPMRMIAPAVAQAIAALGKRPVAQGTIRTDLVQALRGMGCTVVQDGIVPPVSLAYLLASKPTNALYILGVTWNSGAGHWIIVPETRNGSCVFLDPAGGVLTEGALASYTAYGGFDGEYILVS